MNILSKITNFEKFLQIKLFKKHLPTWRSHLAACFWVLRLKTRCRVAFATTGGVFLVIS